MDVKNFLLSHYSNAADGMHIHKVKKQLTEARKPHTHNYFQIYCMIKGSITHFVGGSSSVLSQGEVFIIPPHARHHVKKNEPNAEFYSFCFLEDALDQLVRSGSLASSFLRDLKNMDLSKIHPKVTLDAEETLYAEVIMERILKEFTQRKMGSGEVIRANAVILLTMIARAYFENKPEGLTIDFQTKKQSILHCIQYINDNYAENITLENMAQLSAMSKTSFCTLFSETAGCTLHQYLNRQRIEHAALMIRKGYSLASVSNLCGYSDFSTFFRNFKKITGLSPAQYRKTVLNP